VGLVLDRGIADLAYQQLSGMKHIAPEQDRVIRYGIGWDPRTVNGSDNVYWWTSVNAEVRAMLRRVARNLG